VHSILANYRDNKGRDGTKQI